MENEKKPASEPRARPEPAGGGLRPAKEYVPLPAFAEKRAPGPGRWAALAALAAALLAGGWFWFGGLKPGRIFLVSERDRDAAATAAQPRPDGGMAVYRVSVEVEGAADAAFDLSVNGRPVVRGASLRGPSLELALAPGRDQTLAVTAARGGARLSAKSSVGHMETKTLASGQSELWTIGFKR